MWVTARYKPAAFFSLRPYTATTSGGKSLIVPTPFAVKMALLDAAIRTQGLVRGQALFAAIRDLQIAISLPRQIVVNNTFARILRLKEIKSKASEKKAATEKAIAAQQWPFQRTIAFREYVQFGGTLTLAFQGMALEELTPLLAQISYLGKRGGFMQLTRSPGVIDDLPGNFTVLTEGVGRVFLLGMLQMVDDWGPSMTFEKINVYDQSAKGRIRLGQDRIVRHVVLPFHLARTSKGYALYERIE